MFQCFKVIAESNPMHHFLNDSDDDTALGLAVDLKVCSPMHHFLFFFFREKLGNIREIGVF